MKSRFVLIPLLAAFLTMGGDCRDLDNLNPCVVSGVVQDVPISRIDSVDVLFVIDNSESMQEEQLLLSTKIVEVVQALADGGESNPNIPDFPPVESLRVGVITTDIGSVPFVGQPASGCAIDGDNAELFTTGVDRTPPPPDDLCELYPGEDPPPLPYAQFPLDPFFPAGPVGQADFVDGVQCIVGQGTSGDFGCGYEQQLEATLQSFNTGANSGFVRDEALLAIILVTDEDDCSSEDPDIYDVTDAAGNKFKGPYTSGGALKAELRCFEHKDALWEIQRYVDGVTTLKDSPSKVVFAAIAGIPQVIENAVDPDNPSFDEILADTDMIEVPDGPDTTSQKLRPSCDAGANGEAFPARRIVETAKGLEQEGVRSIVESICEDDYTGLLEDIVGKIGDALRQICLPDSLIRDAEGTVGCQVTETQLAGVSCESVGKGRTFLRKDEDDPDREVCLVEQLPSDGVTVPAGQGWFYDDFSEATEICTFETAQRVSFTENAEPEAGTSVRFECLQGIVPAEPDIGFPCAIAPSECDPSANEISLEEKYDLLSVELFCQEATNTCQIKCTNDAQCPGGFVCFDAEDGGDEFCINPTCTLN